MAKFQSPLLGYNNNVRHKNRVFHIQTEDSGVNHPHIITHLFMDGGRILKSVKKSYAEHVGSDTLKETVRALMKDQHKAMFIALRDGQFDELAEGKKPSDAAVAKVTAPAVVPEATPTKPELPESPPSSEEPSPNTIDESRAAAAAPRTPTLPPPVVMPVTPQPPAVEPFALAEANGPVTIPEAPAKERSPTLPPPTITEPRPSAAELTPQAVMMLKAIMSWLPGFGMLSTAIGIWFFPSNAKLRAATVSPNS